MILIDPSDAANLEFWRQHNEEALNIAMAGQEKHPEVRPALFLLVIIPFGPFLVAFMSS